MNVSDAHAAILVYNYFEQAELEQPLQKLKDSGVAVAVISADKLDMQAMVRDKPGAKFQADLLLRDAKPEDYDILVLPGGVMNADRLRLIETARQWVISFMDEDKLIAAICHAPWLLVSADVVEERRLTSYPTIKDDIRNVGGEWIDLPVVVDHNLITSRRPADLDEFNTAILEWIEKH